MEPKENNYKIVEGRIVFRSDRGGYIFLLQNGKLEKISYPESGRPKISTDGNRIYLGRTGSLSVFDIGQGTSTQFQFLEKYAPTQFDISADEKKILFLSHGGRFENRDPENIYTINIDGTDLKQITFFEGGGKNRGAAGAQYPRWSPDGQWIAFQGPEIPNKSLDANTLYLIKADGTGVKKIIEDKSIRSFGELNWSPDGTKIIFSKWTKKETPSGSKKGSFQIFTVDIKTSNLQRITNGIYNCRYPDFSPDGKQIVYSSNRHPNQNSMSFGGVFGAELFVIDIDGTNERRITPPEIVQKYGLGIFPWDKVYATDTHPDWV